MIKKTIVATVSAIASFALSIAIVLAPLALLEFVTYVIFGSFSYYDLEIGILEFVALRIAAYFIITIVIYSVVFIYINSLKLYKPIHKLIMSLGGYLKAKHVHDKLDK